MNITGWTLVAAPCLAMAAITSAPQVSLPQGNANTRIASAPGDLDDARAWRERFQNSDLSARESDFEALVDHALESHAARAALETWSNDREHLEFAWTCRLALREVNARSNSSGSWSEFDDPFEALRQHMFSGGLGTDPFGGFLTMDPFALGSGGSGALLVPFQSMPQGSQSQSQSEGFSLQMGPDGVKARVKKNVNGEQHEEEYSAKTLDELLLAHPELSSHVRGGSSATSRGFGMRLGLPGFDLARRLSSGMRTDVLGVYIATEPAPDHSASEGLRIERVQPGSLAEKLGLEPGQVLTSLNGRKLNSRDDISNALRERKSDEAVEVEVRDRDGALSTKTWKPSKSDRGEAHPLQPRPLQGTRKI